MERTPDLVLGALGEVAGAALLLDDRLRVTAWTPEAEALLGVPIEAGVAAPSLLCGTRSDRPVAEALAERRPVTASIPLPDVDGRERGVFVRATPLGDASGGWLLVLREDFRSELQEGEVEERWGILTREPAMKRLFRDIEKVAASDAAVLVRGETGSGKELVARAVHEASPRAAGPFRALNCAALPAALLESELFGHVRGAFTGAVRDNLGHFRLAGGGTLFLDEVAELPLELQAKLLRVLQDRKVVPVGGGEPIPVDVRIVTATHRALRREVQEGRFRADLLYRIRVLPLFLPPLRSRPRDVPLLAWRFVERTSERASCRRRVDRISNAALDAMMAYEWPGNVRELMNAIEYAMVMGDGSVLDLEDLPPEIRGDASDESGHVLVPRAEPEAPDLEELDPEARRIQAALSRASGHHGRAAASLGISRTTLWRRMRRYGLG